MKDDPQFISALAPYLTDYLRFKAKLGYTNEAQFYMARELDHYLLFFAVPNIQKFAESRIYHWMHAIRSHSAATKNHRLSFARCFLNYLLHRGVITDNPALRIPFLKKRPFKPYIYTLQDIHRLLQEALRLPCPFGRTLYTVLFLLYACGLRLSEAQNLKIQDVDFEENTLALWQTKFHKERLVPFSPATAKKLQGYLAFRRATYSPAEPQDPFFCSPRGRRIPRPTIEHWFGAIRRRAGLSNPGGEPPRMHDLRHSFAVHRLYKWYQEGYNPLNKLPVLSTYMGHVQIENTQVYLTIAQALLREGDRRFQASFEDATASALRRAFK